jgi:hypothetical protein
VSFEGVKGKGRDVLNRRSKPIPRAVLICAVASVLLHGGCAFGPMALERSHGRFNEAVRRVDEEQLLRNLVHMRYNEIHLSLNVASIAAQYELAGSAEARPFFAVPNPSNHPFRSFTSVLPDVNVSGASRPTLSLIPADNGAAIEKFLTPIPPETLVMLHQTSWPVSTVMRLWVERANGVPNAASASGPQTDQIPDFARFRRIADLCQAAQDLGLGSVFPEERLTPVGGPVPASAQLSSAAVDAAKNGMEYHLAADGQSWNLLRKEHKLVFEVSPAGLQHPIIEELTGLLNLEPGRLRYEIVTAPGVNLDPMQVHIPPSSELKLSLRSASQVYFYLANGVEVPPDHLQAGLVKLPAGPGGQAFDGRAVTEGLFTVHACQGHKPPPTAFVAIKYRDYWYYIDDRDQTSKATFALVLSLSRIDFVRQTVGGPLLTLPVGR